MLAASPQGQGNMADQPQPGAFTSGPFFLSKLIILGTNWLSSIWRGVGKQGESKEYRAVESHSATLGQVTEI